MLTRRAAKVEGGRIGSDERVSLRSGWWTWDWGVRRGVLAGCLLGESEPVDGKGVDEAIVGILAGGIPWYSHLSLVSFEFGWSYKRRLNYAGQIYPSRGRGRDSVTV